jgi:hypothetical protein
MYEQFYALVAALQEIPSWVLLGLVTLTGLIAIFVAWIAAIFAAGQVWKDSKLTIASYFIGLAACVVVGVFVLVVVRAFLMLGLPPHVFRVAWLFWVGPGILGLLISYLLWKKAGFDLNPGEVGYASIPVCQRARRSSSSAMARASSRLA